MSPKSLSLVTENANVKPTVLCRTERKFSKNWPRRACALVVGRWGRNRAPRSSVALPVEEGGDGRRRGRGSGGASSAAVPARGLRVGAAPVVRPLTGVGRGAKNLPSPQEQRCGTRLSRVRMWTHAPVGVAPSAGVAALVVRGGALTLPCGCVCAASDAIPAAPGNLMRAADGGAPVKAPPQLRRGTWCTRGTCGGATRRVCGLGG